MNIDVTLKQLKWKKSKLQMFVWYIVFYVKSYLCFCGDK